MKKTDDNRRRLEEIEKNMNTTQMDRKTEQEYRLWLKANPLSDSTTTPGWLFDAWMDSMPKQFETHFIRDVLDAFPHLKRTYRSNLGKKR